MLERLAHRLIRRRTAILVVTAAALLGAAVFGGGVAKLLGTGGFDDPGSQSSRAHNLLEHRFHAGEPNVVLLLHTNGSVQDPAVAATGRALTAELAHQKSV